MAKNSFLLKGWSITIMGGLLAFSSIEFFCLYLLVSLVITIFFWLLDSYYLHQERLFVKLYDHVRVLPEDKIDFSMNTSPFKSELKWAECTKSDTLKLFYGGLVLVHIIIIFII